MKQQFLVNKLPSHFVSEENFKCLKFSSTPPTKSKVFKVKISCEQPSKVLLTDKQLISSTSNSSRATEISQAVCDCTFTNNDCEDQDNKAHVIQTSHRSVSTHSSRLQHSLLHTSSLQKKINLNQKTSNYRLRLHSTACTFSTLITKHVSQLLDFEPDDSDGIIMDDPNWTPDQVKVANQHCPS